ncbi:MAG: hypothetical protein NTY53_19715 [Kiritimatiellaeota bacterium]|nr:hypothetical protein [Kiritimatiellota bacterium]
MKRKLMAFCVVAFVVGWLVMLPFAMGGNGSHHVILLWPLPQMLVASAVCALGGLIPRARAVIAWALAAPVVVCPRDAAPQVQLAAKEVARYVYLRTGSLPAIAADILPDATEAILLATDAKLGAEAFTIKTTQANGRRVWTISGGYARRRDRAATR